MRWFYKLPLRFRSLFRKGRVEQELGDELRFHLERLIEEKIGKGMTREEARYAAMRELGGMEEIKEECRDMRRVSYLENFSQDLRYGVRMLAKSPSFTAVAVLTLALGIGANTAIFSVVNAVLLQPLPYPDSDRIVNILPRPCCADSTPMFTYWEQNNAGFEDLTAYGDQAYAAINLNGGDKPELVEARKASLNYFRLFGANPTLGRTFSPEEDRPGGPRVLVMSYGLWQRRFSGDPAILGKPITMGGARYTVIGVLSPRFKPFPPAEVWIPLQADPNSTDQAHILMVAGRLRPGVTLARANTWMAVIEKRYVQTHPQQVGNDAELQVVPMQQWITRGLQPTLLILLGAVGMVLLLACANVANLLLARGAGREREIAVRTAVGASRARIVRQLLTESLLLALAGGAVGLAVGSWGVRALLALAPTNAYAPGNLLRVQEMASTSALDPWIAGFAVLLAAATGILFGLLPALNLSSTDLTSSFKESSGRAGIGPRHSRTRNGLVAAEVAIAFVLVCGAGLLIRSFVALRSQSLGIDPDNVLTMAVSLAGAGYSKSLDVDRLARQAVREMEGIPGVESAAMASALPLWGGIDMVFDIPGRPPAKGDRFTGGVEWRVVSPHYFKVFRIPLVSGRLLQEQEAHRTVVIDQAMARKYWPKSNPVGQTIIIGPGLGPAYEEGPAEIVGIVGNVRDWALDQPWEPTMYQTPLEIPDATMAVVNGQWPDAFIVRTRPAVAPMSVSQAVQHVLLAREGLAVTKVRTMEQVSLDSTASQRFTLFLMGVFATAALLLAAIGLYGVISYSVTERTHEIGVRMALGARGQDVLRLVVGQALRLMLTGWVIGILGASALTRLLSSLLYGVKPTDLIAFSVVSLTLGGVAFLACYIPARRATQVDPMVALRYE
jgi:putative ABC transport system permease protein